MGVAKGGHGGGESFVNCYGTLSYEEEKRVDGSTIYDLASLTKALATTLAVLCLMQEEKIKLSDRLGAFFGAEVP